MSVTVIESSRDPDRAYDLASTNPEWLFFHCLQFIDNRAFFNRLTRVNKAHHEKMHDTRVYRPNSPFVTHILTERFELTDFQVEGLKKNPAYATDTVESCQKTVSKLWKRVCKFNKIILNDRKDYDLPILLQQFALDQGTINELPTMPKAPVHNVLWQGFFSRSYEIHDMSEEKFFKSNKELTCINEMQTCQSYIPHNSVMEAGQDADSDESDSYYHSSAESTGDLSNEFHDVTESTSNDVIDSSENDGDEMRDDDSKMNEDVHDVFMSDEEEGNSSSEDEERAKLNAKIIENDRIDVDESDWPNSEFWKKDISPSQAYFALSKDPGVFKQMRHILPVSLFMDVDDELEDDDECDSDYDSDGNENDVPTQQIGLWTGGVPAMADLEQVYASVDFTYVTDHSLADIVEQAHAHFSRSLPIIHAVDLKCNECDVSPVVGALFKCIDEGSDSHDLLCDHCHSQRNSSINQYRVFLGDWLYSLPTCQPITLDENPILSFEVFTFKPTLSALSTRGFFLSLFRLVPSELPKFTFPQELVSNVKKWLGVHDKDQSIGASAAANMRCKVVDALRCEYWQNVMLLGYMKTFNDIRERDERDPLWKPLTQQDFEGVESDNDSDYSDYEEYDPEVMDGMDPEWDDANALNEQETNDIRAKLAMLET